MKRVHYAGGIFITSDEVAQELLEYAAELANDGQAATVEVPGLHEDGARDDFAFVIGPASQVMIDGRTPDFALDVDGTVARLREARLRRLAAPVDGVSARYWSTQSIDDL